MWIHTRCATSAGFTVLTGSPGHGHAHFPFAETVTTEQRAELATKLRTHFDGDDKIAANDYLRPPCTLNWKSGAPRFPATKRTGSPTETRLADPFEPTRVKPYVLAGKIGADLANMCTTNGQQSDTPELDIPGADDAPKSVDLSRYPAVKEVLDEPHPDRSTHISHVVRAGHDSGLLVPEVRWVVNQRADLVEKLAQLAPRDDVLENWRKVAGEWPHKQIRMAAQIDAILADLEAKYKAKAKAKWTFVDGATFILDIPANIPALWGEGDEVLWAEGESLMIAAPLGLGKTTLGSLLLRAQLGIGKRSTRLCRCRGATARSSTWRWTAPRRSPAP